MFTVKAMANGRFRVVNEDGAVYGVSFTREDYAQACAEQLNKDGYKPFNHNGPNIDENGKVTF